MSTHPAVNPHFENVKKWVRALHGPVEHEADQAAKMLNNFAAGLMEKLPADPDNPAFEKIYYEHYDTPSPTTGTKPRDNEEEAGGADEEDGVPELLPFSKMPGYLLDPWGVPYRQKKQGRREGKVTLENYFYNPKGGGKPRHICRYSITVDGRRRRFYPKYLMRARLHAVQEWRRKDGAEVAHP